MKVCVQWLAQLRIAAGKSEEIVEQEEGHSLSDLVQAVARTAEPALRELLLDADDAPRRSLLLIVNEQSVAHDQADSILLSDGDTICLLPPISGG